MAEGLIEQGLKEFGWRDVGVEGLGSLSLTEIGHMLRDIAWREVKKGWKAEAHERSKLEVLRGLLAIDGKARCVAVNCKRQRRMVAKLRGETVALRIETGRWNGLKREERSCKQCTVEEVEDEEHFLLRCEGWRQEREMLAGFMGDLEGEFCTATDDRKVALILDRACSNGRVGKAVEKMWQCRFLQSA